MNINLNTRKQLSSKVSNSIIQSFESLIKIGNSIPSAIEILILVEKGSTKRVLERVNHNILKLDMTIGDALNKEGIIKENEIFLINRSTNALEAIRSILAVRNLSGNFEQTFLKLFTFPLIAILIGLLIAYFSQPTFYNMVNTLVEQVKVTKGIDPSDESALIWYLQNRDLTLLLIQVYLVLVFSLIFYYIYTIRYKPEYIYKIVSLKSYDDMPYILMLMYNLQKVGLDQVRVFQLLKKSSPRPGWIKLFEKLEKEAMTGRYIHPIFEKFNFPKEVILVLKSAEVSKTFWENMPALINYVKETNEKKNKQILSMFGGISTIAGFMIILYFVAGMFMAMFSLQSLAMAMM